ncbi:MAG: LPXTG cell wall anchor domain-containing protein, partial [Weissella cibaria]
ETAPDGYVKATDVTFNVGAKLTANADGTGDAYTSTFKETTNPAVLTNVDVKDGSVTANVPNQLDIKAVFQVKKVDQDNKPLAGAVFQYFTDVTQKTGMNKDDTTGMHTMPTGQTLEFNKLYTLNESTVPTGYERAEDVYFKVLKQADFTTQTGVTVPADLANEKVLFVKTDKDGAVTDWIKPDQNKNIFTTTFTVENKKQDPLQSIFPVTGGTGIMGFVIVGLILVGAAGALTLKRKFND